MKRLFCLLLCIVCVLLCACGMPLTPEPTAAPAPTPTATPVPTPTPTPVPEPEDGELVLIKDYAPDILIDLRYATENNFTGAVIYDSGEAYLRYGTVKKLMQVQETVKKDGFCLLIWDAYRPVSAQFRLWEIYPDPTYVSNPNNGYSKHSRGNTVDITLVKADGASVAMPSGFDDFSALADRNYGDVSAEAAANSQYLENVMVQFGFVPYSGEWWHYSDSTSYDVITE